MAARNKYGWGSYSTVVSVLAAVIPDAPSTVFTVQDGLFSELSWNIPAANGADVESFEIVIQGVSTGFAASDTCTGDDPALTECQVAYSELTGADFGLELGDLIVVQVRAINEIGSGPFSVLNDSGDIVRTVPRSPPDALEEGPSTDDSQIEVTWSALSGIDTGYDSITRYTVFWDNGSSGTDWVLIETQDLGSFTYSYIKSTGI